MRLCVSQGNEKAKAELENDIRKVFAEHNLGNVGTRLTYEEDRRLVHRVGQQFEELNKDYYQLKVWSTWLLSCLQGCGAAFVMFVISQYYVS